MQAGWRSRFLLLRITLVFGLLIGAYYAIAATDEYETRVLDPYVRINADLSGRILGLLGYEVVADGGSLASPGFRLTVRRGCDGLEATALFVAAVLAFAAPILLKLPALAIGIPLLVALNLVRIVSLFLVGIHYPRLFHTMHADVWQVLYIVAGIALFAVWLMWASRKLAHRAVVLAILLAAAAPAWADPLPSWNGGRAKASILSFVAAATTDPAGKAFILPAERIAVFDNDGTLWAEHPIYFQFAFALDRVKALAPKHPEWKTQQPFAGVLSGDTKAVLASGEQGIVELVMATHPNMTTDEFAKTVADWLESARHPRFGRPYTELVYQPMLELLEFLRANGFKTFIVSGGGIEFMRVFAERVYGIPPEQVIGSRIVTRFEIGPDGVPVLRREPKIEFVDDGPGKPVAIQMDIGRRPVFAFGNSDGDQQMLQWTAAAAGPRFVGLVHHTDAAREWAYDRTSHIGKLDKALDEANARAWIVVDMKTDWNKIFPFE